MLWCLRELFYGQDNRAFNGEIIHWLKKKRNVAKQLQNGRKRQGTQWSVQDFYMGVSAGGRGMGGGAAPVKQKKNIFEGQKENFREHNNKFDLA